jgi:mono/diheme cytochrome c family protein
MVREKLRPAAIAAVLILVAVAIALAFAYRPAIATIARPDARSFSRVEVEKGAGLALIGDCMSCHTSKDGLPYAGGLAFATPFGTVFSTNITPDGDTGIGRWPREAFRRAMREGVSRDGSHLYPVFPYEYFTRVADDDLDALYAFLMTRTAITARAPENQLIPPLGFRPLLAGWKLVFLARGERGPTTSRSADWNRGAILVAGLGHCGACHTPRNLFGAEKRDASYAGGWVGGWYAPALDATSPARRAWTVDRLTAYLRTGLDANHAAAAGPMGPVSFNLARAPEADVHAIAVYTASLMETAPGAKQPDVPALDKMAEADRADPVGAAMFAGACAACHGPGAPMIAQGRPSLSLGSPLRENDPRDAIQIILQGLEPPADAKGPYMPAFAAIFDDVQIGEIAAYIRTRYSDQPMWPALKEASAAARRGGAKP